MIYNYVALAIFIAFAVFVPASFLLTAKLLGKRGHGNKVSNAPYESGEETTGTGKDIDNEYLPHFMIFLPFEIVVVIMILWSTVTKSTGYYTDMAIIMIGFVAVIFSIVGYKLASG